MLYCLLLWCAWMALYPQTVHLAARLLTAQDAVHIFMEYMDRGSLRDAIERNSNFSLSYLAAFYCWL